MVYSIMYSKKHIPRNELKSVITTVMEIVEKHDPIALQVGSFYKKLQDLEGELQEYTIAKTKHELTAQINVFRRQRLETCMSIAMQMRVLKKSRIKSNLEAVKLITPVVENYLHDLRKLNRIAAVDKVRNFLIKIESSEALLEAANVTGIKDDVTELKSLQSNLDIVEKIRREDNSIRRERPLNKQRSELLNALDNLLLSIELAKRDHADLNYEPLIAELNEFLVNYQSLKRSKITRARNEAIKKETVVMSSKTTTTAI